MSQFFPDGTKMETFFLEHRIPQIEEYGRQYVVTDYGIKDDGQIYTEAFQKLIDEIHANGGGVLVVPKGTYRTGALFLKQGVHLYLEEGGILLGSDDIADYPLLETRIEGESCLYFSALINAYGIDRLLIGGKGIIDGNGAKSWRAFWLRRKWNPDCTNKDEQRPRLLYLSNCSNVVLSGLTLQNSHFWTTHIYRCDHVKFLGLRILSPGAPQNAPSTDAIDIDACSDILIHGCYMSVNDDAVALKGGKGKTADRLPENGANERIVIEDCEFGFCHSCLTFGSESIHDRNIAMRRINVNQAEILLRLKFRPDTPQHYEYCKVCEIEGEMQTFLHIDRWKQFADGASMERPLASDANNFLMADCNVRCKTFYHVPDLPEDFKLRDFTLRNITAKAKEIGTCPVFVTEEAKCILT